MGTVMNESRRQILLDTPHTETATGAIASFETDMVGRAKEVKVEIEPVQDLHGYDNPWPAGGGVNLFDADAATDNTRLNNTGRVISYQNYCTSDYIPVESNTVYCVNNTISSAIGYGMCAYDAEKTYLRYFYKSGGGTIAPNVGENAAFVRVTISMDAKNTTMVVKGSSIPAYAPYSNICPITGWDGVSIDTAVEAYKLLPTVAQTRWESSGIIIDYVGRGKYRIHGQRTGAVALPTIPVEPFIIPSDDGRRFEMHNSEALWTVFIYFKSATGSTVDYWTMNPVDRVTSTYTLMAGKSVAGFEIRCTADDSIDFTIEPTFSKNKTSTVPISWADEAGTVYGGTLEWEKDGTVTLTKTMASVDLGTLTWTLGSSGRHSCPNPSGIKTVPNTSAFNGVCSQYRVVSGNTVANENAVIGMVNATLLQVNDSILNGIDATSFKTAMSGVQLVYELATPVTYTLTSTEALVFLRGTNNVWNDINDTSVTYWTHKTGDSV